jgi:hypothetical protein
MSEKVSWKFNIQVVGGPTLVASGEENVDAYNKSQVVVPAPAAGVNNTVEVNLNSARASHLIVKASHYLDTATPPSN